ncbi:MAG: phosphoribosylamine--glycine ligase [Clostridia bacterium]|nr:phosphoribosylamine--glycine ligase [Clostridia bacterium]
MAVTPPTNLPTITAGSISGAKPAVKPIWSPNTKAALTAKAMLTTLPRSSISFTRSKVAMELARVAIKPPAAISLMPSRFPSSIRGLRRSVVSTWTSGNAPASTMAMAPTVANPSDRGAMPGIMANPVNSSTLAAPNPTVIKADGLALGKGVIIAMTREEACDAVRSMMGDKVFGASGDHIVIEEFLTGPEVSVLSFTDGKTVIPMVSSMDHKRAGDNDTGLNTGGMGTVAPNPYYTSEIAEECMKTIFLPTVTAMNAEVRTFRGCLYFGLMLTPQGPRVIEYNCRFGDPETQVVLPLLESDLLTVMQATTNSTLSECEVCFSEKSACCVIMASGGYPEKYNSGYEISIAPEARASVYVAGAKCEEGKLLTAGGRVLGVTEIADTLGEAIAASYKTVEKISFEGAHYRRDIGARAMKAINGES